MTRMIGRVVESYSSIPKPVRSFLLRGLIIFVVWKTLYLGFLAYPRTLDRPLTLLVGDHSVWVLNQASRTHAYTAKEMLHATNFEGEIKIMPVSLIAKNGKKVVRIEDGCNGLELFLLYIGFILAMPAPWKRKLLFIPLGIVVIHVVNVLRCVGLCVLIQSWKEHFDLAHHYIFKMVIYGVIFALWVKFSAGINFQKQTQHDL